MFHQCFLFFRVINNSCNTIPTVKHKKAVFAQPVMNGAEKLKQGIGFLNIIHDMKQRNSNIKSIFFKLLHIFTQELQLILVFTLFKLFIRNGNHGAIRIGSDYRISLFCKLKGMISCSTSHVKNLFNRIYTIILGKLKY